MVEKIVVAGGTGNLGQRIVKALIERGADVVVLSRVGTDAEKLKNLTDMGAKIAIVNRADAADIAKECAGASCVVSALAGLRDVIVDGQNLLLEGAIAAGVKRFIPSDFSTDYMQLIPGENRNFDLRREFYEKLNNAPIQTTHIFNGAFAEILNYSIPVLDFKTKSVCYWGDPNWKMDFTAMDDVAAFTSATALDPSAPKVLHIASFQMSPNDLVAFSSKTFGHPFKLVLRGSLEDLRAYNKEQRAAHPEGENELYAKWQQSQYIQSMFTTQHATLDNDRYPGIEWKILSDLIPPVSR
jgi:nucleoside-diphosphate-sugar epimerase